MKDSIRYVPPKALLPLAKPREVTVTLTRKLSGDWHTSMPVEDLDYLIALEWQRNIHLPGLDVRSLRMDKPRRKPNQNPNQKNK
jgi:hypothetical protein